MANLLGIVAILVASLFVFVLAIRVPAISKLLIFAFIARILLSLFNVYIGGLPDSGSDAVSFEGYAWKWSQGDFSDVFFNFTYGKHGYIVSWIIALFYNLTDRSLLASQTLSVIFGMGSIYLGWKLSEEMWSKQVAIKSTWLMAFFPSWMLYSVLILREVYVYFFILFALIGVVRWVKFNKLLDLLIAVFGFIVASFFHGVMFLGLLVLIGFVFYRAFVDLLLSLKTAKLSLVQLVSLLACVIVITAFFQSWIVIPYLGTFGDIAVETIINRSAAATAGGSALPQWLIPQGLWELIWKTPVRIMYLFFSPFPWDISKLGHIIGFLDGVLYLILFWLIWVGRKFIFKNRSAKILFSMLLVYVLVFSIGIGNSGTATRHRAKMFPIIFILVAPCLPVIRFGKGGRNFAKRVRTSDSEV
jgi:4-amino-4-deoxy-L-arabinose transferase-like glycosyltransferase